MNNANSYMTVMAAAGVSLLLILVLLVVLVLSAPEVEADHPVAKEQCITADADQQ